MSATAADIVAAYSKYGVDTNLANAIVSVAGRVGISDPGWLANVIRFESKFDPQAVNAGSGATGLIQFMPGSSGAAAEVGTSTTALAKMTALQQMAYVEKYFKLSRIAQYAPFDSQLKVFMAVFYPAAIPYGPDYVFSSSVQAANPGIASAQDYYDLAMNYALLPGGTATALMGASAAGSVLLAVVGVVAIIGLALTDGLGGSTSRPRSNPRRKGRKSRRSR